MNSKTVEENVDKFVKSYISPDFSFRKYQKEIMKLTEMMTLEGYCILTPIYPTISGAERTEEEIIKLKKSHFKKIELSDAILVVNINNYIGESTKLEIEYAKSLKKEIMYYINLK